MLSITIDDGLNSIVLNWEHHSVDIMELSKKVEEVCYREFRPTKHAPDVLESAASISISTASEVSASEADSSLPPRR